MSIDTQTPIADTPAVNNNNNNNNNDNGDNTINSNTNSNDRNGSSSPSKNRRRRRRNKNKNKNKNNNNNNNNNNDNKSIQSMTNKPKISNKEKILNQQTKLHLNRKSKKKNPWQKVNNSSTFENIMKQQTKINQNPIYNDTQIPMNEEDILEQQMILQAIAESNKLQKQQETETINTNKNKDDEKKQEIDQQNIDNNNNNNNNNNKKNEEDEKQIIEKTDNNNININDELIAATINAQSDEMLAIQLQQQEQKELLRRQKMSKIYDGKYAKVTSSSSHPTAIPKAALNFYYDDTSMLNGGLTKEQYQEKLLQIQSSEESIIDRNTENTENTENVEIEQETVAISKHDAKIWSETHMNRLNEYETGGDLNTNMNIGNQAYNAFRNQLDKKGYISYHNYQLEPKDKKR